MTDGQRPRAAREVFDALGVAYEEAYGGSPTHRRSVEWLTARLAPRSRVLDVGCGTGRPTARALADAGHMVVGVDVSPVMVELATRAVPDAVFRCADVRDVSPAEGAYDAVCVYFSLLQMRRREQIDLMGRLAGSLSPSGLLVWATVPVDGEDVEHVFMGHPVRVSGFSAQGCVALAEDVGLRVLERLESEFTPAGPFAEPEPQLFLHCRRGARRPV
ncbi:class I SAM-dependent methyltransferase [Streptomyces sp. ZYX-F-203]